MITKELMKLKKGIILHGICIFIAASFIYLVIAVVLQIKTNELKKSEIIRNEEILLNAEQDVISYRVDRVVSDVLYIADSFEAHSVDSSDFTNIEKEWISFSNRKRIYDQIRFIDVDGNERIRINYSEKGATEVGKGQLQNKKDSYYFTASTGLKKDQIYISKLDLNVDNDKIEQPSLPTIRFATPVFGQDGKIKGVVILNYYANYVLRQFEDVSLPSYGNMILLNSNGYWLFNKQDRDKEWTFMYNDKKNVSFKNEFSKEWNLITSSSKGSFDTENGYYSYSNISFNDNKLADKTKSTNEATVLDEGNWIAVSVIPKSREAQLMIFTDVYTNIRYILKNNIPIFIFIAILSAVIALLMAINKLSKERIKYFSEYDSMTGALNRRAGFEILNKIYQDFARDKVAISICFCDINGLKEVNDNLGHVTGDELISTIVSVIKKHIRESDFIIRLGGDEFLIIFVNSDIEQSEKIWSRINDEFTRVNQEENRKYIISISHGIEEFKFNSNEYIDEIINSADSKMYNEKRIIKRNFKAIK